MSRPGATTAARTSRRVASDASNAPHRIRVHPQHQRVEPPRVRLPRFDLRRRSSHDAPSSPRGGGVPGTLPRGARRERPRLGDAARKGPTAPGHDRRRDDGRRSSSRPGSPNSLRVGRGGTWRLESASLASATAPRISSRRPAVRSSCWVTRLSDVRGPGFPRSRRARRSRRPRAADVRSPASCLPP